jgi:hypothetical protein
MPRARESPVTQTKSKTKRASLSLKQETSLVKSTAEVVNAEEISNTYCVPGAEFEVFWLAYPRKIGRQAAESAWKKLNPSPALVGSILNAIETQSRSKDWKEGFILAPVRWLTEHRWEDEMEPASMFTKQGQETKSNLDDWLNRE